MAEIKNPFEDDQKVLVPATVTRDMQNNGFDPGCVIVRIVDTYDRKHYIPMAREDVLRLVMA